MTKSMADFLYSATELIKAITVLINEATHFIKETRAREDKKYRSS